MAISVGDALPAASLVHLGADGPAEVKLNEKTAGRKVVIFALPGAYTGTCSTAHVPSFMRTIDQFKAKGVDEEMSVSVNDPFVKGAWGDAAGDPATYRVVRHCWKRFDPKSQIRNDAKGPLLGAFFIWITVGFIPPPE